MSAPRRTALAAGLGAAAMLGLAFASVPLYRMFCEATGFGGTTARADGGAIAATAPSSRTLFVRFDANVAPGMGWSFKPAQVTQQIRIGERKLAFYTATNPAAYATRGTAVFNVTPDTVGKYFTKIECFCFEQQTLAAGQTAQMPVLYYVDPAFLTDPDAAKVEEVTLSYTFFPVAGEAVNTAARTAPTPQG